MPSPPPPPHGVKKGLISFFGRIFKFYRGAVGSKFQFTISQNRQYFRFLFVCRVSNTYKQFPNCLTIPKFSIKIQISPRGTEKNGVTKKMSLATENKCAMSCDWLSFTYKPDISKALVYNHVDRTYDDMVHNEFDCFLLDFPEIADIMIDSCFLRCRTHYDHVLAFDDWFRISYNDTWSDAKNGVNVQIPSHGLEKFASLLLPNYDGDNILQDLLKLLYLRSCQVSRIDLAFDDYSKTFRPRQYLDWWNNDQIITRYSKVQFCSSQREYGNTIYFGSRKTGKMLRIYDKDFESKGEYDAVRYEFELHSKYAKDMFQYLIDNDGICFSSYILNFFRVVDNSGKDKCVTRMPILKEWEEFLAKSDFCEEVKKVTIPTYTLDARKTDTTYWLLNNCLSNIKGYAAVFGWESLQTYVQNDTKPIPPKYQALLTLAQRTDWDECYDE